ncbi:MFS transporter [Actinotignum urinale]|uniref:MFS transporter n=1 Tax=Actinotignum urinale TaxID=190146 RepID=A0AAW9HLB1_9ACTO|nr:MFS transporter [Actinotignum urinale]MDY5133150.1 MFS transporter [Actinotignum urinale]MDY5154441.1 MFS transporter [Actinotignum urinale]MDY5160451.1 MFS transporter [Actinotignum urinale]WIK59662.1 MFS transporter [Actinotignum urinale]
MKTQEFQEIRGRVKVALPLLLIVFTFGMLMLQAFNSVLEPISKDLNVDPTVAGLVTSLPGIVLGVVCMLYGTLCDFISPKYMTVIGVSALVLGSFIGFFGAGNIWLIIVARVIQVAGGQVAGSVYLVMAVKYTNDREKAVYLGLFNAIYYLSAVFGVAAGGYLAQIDWKYLFLIPAISIFFIPLLVKYTPDVKAKGEKIDFIGIAVFAVFASLLAIYFAFMHESFTNAIIIAMVVFGVAFIVWVLFGQKFGVTPFIDLSFITNGRYMGILSIQFLFFFFNFAFVPVYMDIAANIYQASQNQTTVGLIVIYGVATVVGLISGPIVNTLGRKVTIILSGICLVVGYAGIAFLVSNGLVLVTLLSCVAIAGLTAVYTPIYDAATDALPVEQNGRGVGVLDLIMNTSGSIGIAIYFSLIAREGFGSSSLLGITLDEGSATSNSNILIIIGAIALVGLVISVVFSKMFGGNRAVFAE